MTHFMTRLPLTAVTTLLMMAGAGEALAQPAPDGRAAVLQNLQSCKAKTDAAERLACYDEAAEALDTAERKGDIVVVDREQAKAARRQAFGFSLPSLDVFNRSEAPAEVDRLTAVVDSAYRGSDGRWVIELEGGAVWAQVDQEPLPRTPKKGSPAEIRKASLGSYFINIDGQRALRVRRIK